jgi:hypothetical protein
MPGGFIPPVKRSQPFVARDGKLYRVVIVLKHYEKISLRMRADNASIAMYRTISLYRRMSPRAILECTLLEDVSAPKRTPYIQILGRGLRRLFKTDK